ncbi:serine/threonine protein kinase [Corallococcus sp. AB049A]|uniref:non-specific serine/threonine protein kinase n=2 Tax=Myxococcaceae TaxID=31 RepID=A0A3A8QWY6_9BACT|nr:serine/threonine protein kinase [Corallococcus sp. AB050B]RKH69362.1 serine/threonine protein kinase [Corallococcus interemptor]RKI52784.1 serine/threonine protein kinase [Corallococcus sp. AB049A]
MLAPSPLICSCGQPHSEAEACPTLMRGLDLNGGTMLYAGTPPPGPAASLPAPPTPMSSLTPVVPSLVGQEFGRFRVVRELGRGGMGTVFLAEHTLIQKRVAIKVLHAHLAQAPELVARFLSEARTLTLVQHENVVTLYDLDSRDGRPYLVMEYLEGDSLANFARGPMAPALVVELMTQVCDALGAAHAHGIVHRDLKPANVFLVPNANGKQRVKLLDFGIAKLLSRPAGEMTTEVGVLLGTPEFMAPEQCGDGIVDARSDLYAAGVLAYLLLTGQVPFYGRTAAEILVGHLQKEPVPPHELNPAVPEALSRVLLRALAKRPDHRFASAAELKTALEASLAPPPAPSAPPLTALLRGQGTQAPVELKGEWVGRSGLFFQSTSTPPALLSEVSLVLRLPGGELPCTAQVVRHVTAEQAQAWNMSPGFGVQLRDASPAFQAQLAQLKNSTRATSAQTAAIPTPEDAQAEAVLQGFRRRLAGDPYAVLELPRDATLESVRTAAQRARGALELLKARPLSDSQRAQVDRALDRVAGALHTLGNVERRVEYDATLGNVEGIERCLAAGLTATMLEQCRRRFLAGNTGREGRAAVHRLSGDALASVGRLEEALAAYELAVRADPLDLEGLKRWRFLRARVRGSAAPR